MSNRSWLTQGLSSLSNFRHQLTEFTSEVLQEVTASNDEDRVVDLADAQHYIRSLKQELAAKSDELETCIRDIEFLRSCPRCHGDVSNLHRDVAAEKEGNAEVFSFDSWSKEDALTIGSSDQRDSRQQNVVEQFSPTAYEFEVRRLKDEVKQLKAECLHWKALSDGKELRDKKDEVDKLRRELQALQEREARYVEEVRVLSELNQPPKEAQRDAEVAAVSSGEKTAEESCWTDDWGYAGNWDEECEKHSQRSSFTEGFDSTAEANARRERKSTESATDDVCDTDWREQIQTIQQERDQALEELDREHQEAINQLLSSKEALGKTCDELREQNVQLLEKVSFWKLKAEEAYAATNDSNLHLTISSMDLENQLRTLNEMLRECRRRCGFGDEECSSVPALLEALFKEAEQFKNEVNVAGIVEVADNSELGHLTGVAADLNKKPLDYDRTIEEYKNTIISLTEKIKQLEVRWTEDDDRNNLPAMHSAVEAFDLDVQQLVHSVCKKCGLSESKELELIKYIGEMGDESQRRDEESTSWQWLMPRSPDHSGENCSVDVKTLHSGSTTNGSFSAPPSDEFGESPTLLQSQAKAIEELNEKNHVLTSRLKNAEDLAAYQSTVISFLRQSVEQGFRQLQRTVHLLGRYRYYVGGITSNNIESIDSFPYVHRTAIEYPHDRVASAKSENYVFPATLVNSGSVGRRRTRSVGPIVYRPGALQEKVVNISDVMGALNESAAGRQNVPFVRGVAESDDGFVSTIQSGWDPSTGAPSYPSQQVAVLEDQVNDLQCQLKAAKTSEEQYENALKEAIRFAEEERNLLTEKYEGNMSSLRTEVAALTEQLDLERELGSKSSFAVVEKDRELKTLKDECEKLSVRLSFLEDLEAEKEKMESKVADLETHLVTMYADREQLVAAINEHYGKSTAYQMELQEIAALLSDQQQSNLLEEGQLKSAVEMIKQRAATSDSALTEMQAKIDQLNAEAKSMEKELFALVEQLRSKDEAIASLQAQHAQCEELRNKVPALETARSRAVVEVERLRSHLMEIEINHNQEACKAEDRESELRTRLREAESRVAELSEMSKMMSEKATAEFTELHEKLVLAIEERDSANMQRKMLQSEFDRCQQSLHNLQKVLVTFQEERDLSQQQVTKRFTEEIEDLRTQVSDAKAANQVLEEQISQQSSAIQRLYDLDTVIASKDERVASLESEVVDRERRIMTLEKQMEQMQIVYDGKIDKDIIKNLLMGYFTAPTGKKSEVVHLLGSVLGFTEEEFSRIRNFTEGGSGWLNFLNSGTSPAVQSNEQSLVGQFVKFLESESSPKPEVKPVPLASSSQDAENTPSAFVTATSFGVASSSSPAPSLDAPVMLNMPVFDMGQQHVPGAEQSPPVSSADFLRHLLNS
uniref:GRIP domain-containing protein n=1 Tax=Trichuris muris TaxID=70415 RepID=A0A5S6QWY9_TRIMR